MRRTTITKLYKKVIVHTCLTGCLLNPLTSYSIRKVEGSRRRNGMDSKQQIVYKKLDDNSNMVKKTGIFLTAKI